MKLNHRRRRTGMDLLEGSRGREVSTEGGAREWVTEQVLTRDTIRKVVGRR